MFFTSISDMLPSEIAKALKLEYDALKCQGKRTDLLAELEEILSEQNAYKCDSGGENLTSGPVGRKLEIVDAVADKNEQHLDENER